MYEYRANIESVYDGDGSFNSTVDLGLGISVSKKIRVYGIDTPEMRGDQYDAGKIVRDFVRELILGKDVVIKTKKDKTGKYGRLLANISIDGNDLGAILLDHGFAKEYFGGTKEEWSKEDLDNILNYNIDADNTDVDNLVQEG